MGNRRLESNWSQKRLNSPCSHDARLPVLGMDLLALWLRLGPGDFLCSLCGFSGGTRSGARP